MPQKKKLTDVPLKEALRQQPVRDQSAAPPTVVRERRKTEPYAAPVIEVRRAERI